MNKQYYLLCTVLDCVRFDCKIVFLGFVCLGFFKDFKRCKACQLLNARITGELILVFKIGLMKEHKIYFSFQFLDYKK